MSICTHAQNSIGAYKQGYYIDSNGETYHGLIKTAAADNFPIKFKKDAKDKPVKFDPEQIKGYVIDNDAFAVVKNFEVPYSLDGALIPAAFAKVIKAGKVTLYHNVVSLGFGNTMANVESYLLKKSNNTRVPRVPTGSGRFKDRLSSFFSDSPKLSQEIKDRTLTLYIYNTNPIHLDKGDSYNKW